MAGGITETQVRALIEDFATVGNSARIPLTAGSNITLVPVGKGYRISSTSSATAVANTIRSSTLSSNVDLASVVDSQNPPQSMWTAWTDTVSLTAVTSAEAGNVLLLGEAHGEMTTASGGGGDRVVTEIRLVRTRNSVDTIISDHVDYGPRNLNIGGGNDNTAFEDATDMADEELVSADTSVAGDTYKIQVRMITQDGTGNTLRFTSGDRNKLTLVTLKGVKGDTGAQGLQGIQGVQGNPGAKGDKGDTGDTGAQGNPGPQGAQGNPGPQGNQGPKGDKGDKGDTGAAGSSTFVGLTDTPSALGSAGQVVKVDNTGNAFRI